MRKGGNSIEMGSPMSSPCHGSPLAAFLCNPFALGWSTLVYIQGVLGHDNPAKTQTSAHMGRWHLTRTRRPLDNVKRGSG